jgi:hypothetical protein
MTPSRSIACLRLLIVGLYTALNDPDEVFDPRVAAMELLPYLFAKYRHTLHTRMTIAPPPLAR